MELRSFSHLHFFQALKDGLVVKTLSVYRGRPVIKFKALTDIYEAEDEKNQNPNDEFEGFLPGGNRIKFERPIVSDYDVSDLSCSEDDNGINSDSDDDLGDGKITLMQLKERCKAKRKRSENVDSRAGESCIDVKEETDEDECDLTKPLITWKTKFLKNVKSKNSCLKSHVSTAPQSALLIVKAEQISSQEDFLVSDESLPVAVKVKAEAREPNCSDYQNANDSLLCDDRVVSLTDSQKSRAAAKVATECDLDSCISDSSLIFNDKADYCREVSSEATVMGTESGSYLIYDGWADCCEELPGEMPMTATEPESLIYDDLVDSRGEVFSEVPVIDTCDQADYCEVEWSGKNTVATEIDLEKYSVIYDDLLDSCEEVLCEVPAIDTCDQADHCEVEQSDTTTVATEFDLEKALIAPTKEHQHSVISDNHHESSADYKHTKVVNSVVDSCGTVPREVTEIATECLPGTEAIGIEKLSRCVLNEACYDYVNHAHFGTEQSSCMSCVDIKKVDNTEANNDMDSDFPGSESECEGYVDQIPYASISQEPMLPKGDCSADSNSNVPYTGVSTHEALQQIESNIGSDLCAMDDSDRGDSPSIHDTNCTYSSFGGYSLASNGFFDSSPEDSPMPAEKQSLQSFAVSKKCEMPELDSPPQRLLSTRKAISPDSQQKLCKAMESVGIHQEEHDSPRNEGYSRALRSFNSLRSNFVARPHKKLRFEKQSGDESKVNKTEMTGRITKIRFSVKHKQNVAKPKHEKRSAQSSAASNGVPRFTTGCNSIESCRQSAIAFSQRQMQDIECLVTKLANELKSMKEIAEDRLHYDTSPSLSMKHKPNEVRMAIKSATKVDQLTNKWLSMMARDCNRFCKIMTLAETDPETESVTNKERKKITFADEAGEELCHVKYFEKSLSESSEPDLDESNQLMS